MGYVCDLLSQEEGYNVFNAAGYETG